MTTPQGGRGQDLLAEFAAFLEFRQREAAEQAGDGVDVPLFERLADGAERSATLPMRLARPLLEEWGWLKAEGSDDGSTDGGQADAGGGGRTFFQQLTGGQQRQGGPGPASGQRPARKAAS